MCIHINSCNVSDLVKNEMKTLKELELKNLGDNLSEKGFEPIFTKKQLQDLGRNNIKHYLSLLDKNGIKYLIHNGKIGLEKDYEYELKIEDHMKIAVIGTLMSIFDICEHNLNTS